jgi:hypothetical protein
VVVTATRVDGFGSRIGGVSWQAPPPAGAGPVRDVPYTESQMQSLVDAMAGSFQQSVGLFEQGSTVEKPLTRGEVGRIVDYLRTRQRVLGSSGGVTFYGSRREMAAVGVFLTGRLPSGHSVEGNVRHIRSLAARPYSGVGLIWANLVREYGQWDYKRQLGDGFDVGGNINYGATGRAAGFTMDTLLRASGAVQWLTGKSSLEYGTPFDPPGSPFGDPNTLIGRYDTWMIQLGYAIERHIK